MQNTYLFYDTETTGLNKCFDQVLQFAAIRTDLDLNELERHEIFIKLNPDVIPSPTAILIHQISLSKLHDGINEYEGIKKIHALLNKPGTISVGYNTLGFDDEFLRFSFYRNLLTPYTHQFASGCGRMDIYPIAVVYHLFKPEVINWPKIDGSTSLKLEHLNAVNNLAVGDAHEAMCDVEATIELARRLKKEDKMWDYLCGSFNKKTDMERLNNLSFIDHKYQQALLIDGIFGFAKNYQVPVIGLGIHNHYKNQSLWLPLDSFDFAKIELNNIDKTTFVNRKRFGESPILLPLTKRFSRYLNDERLNLMKENASWIQKNQGTFLKIIAYHKEYKYPEIPNLDVDAALYQVGFMSDSEFAKCQRFHRAKPEKKLELIEDFADQNLREQAIRVLGRNYPEALAKNSNLFKEFSDYLDKIKASEIMCNYKNDLRLTPKAALAEIETLRTVGDLTIGQGKLLDELSDYI